MPKRANNESNIRKTATTALVGLLVTIIVYSIIGLAINWMGATVYDETPATLHRNFPDEDITLNVYVRNNAPYTLPLMNSNFALKANVNGDNGEYAYYDGLGNSKRNFSEWGLDIGLITAGNQETIPIKLHPSDNNFNITVDLYLNFFVPLKVHSITYQVNYENIGDYYVTRLDR